LSNAVDALVQRVAAGWPFLQPFQPCPQAHDNFPPINLAGHQLHNIFGNKNLDLNHAPPNVVFDLNEETHHVDNDDFLELNDLINPVIPGPPLVVMGLIVRAQPQP
jgi:hypothetical protein